MKKSILTLFFAFLVVLSSGCAPNPTPIPLESGKHGISLEFLQNGISVPVASQQDQSKVILKPASFTIMIYGAKELVSIMALKSADLAAPLLQASKPVVRCEGTGYLLSYNDLYVLDQPVDLPVLNSSSFASQYLALPDFATSVADSLKKQFGTEPLMLMSGRAYLDFQAGIIPNYLIKTINGKAPQSGDSIVLFVFVEKETDAAFCHVLKWFMFNLEFKPTNEASLLSDSTTTPTPVENVWYQYIATVPITSVTNATQEEIASLLFTQWLNHFKTEKVHVDYRLEDFQLLRVVIYEKQLPDDFVAMITFSVKPANMTFWMAGNGISTDGVWVRNKLLFIGVKKEKDLYRISSMTTGP